MKTFIISALYLFLVIAGYQFLPEYILYNKKLYIILMPFAIAVLGFPYLVKLVISIKKIGNISPNHILSGLMIAGLVGSIIANYIQRYFIDKEFAKNAIETNGVVVDKFKGGSKNNRGMQIICEFYDKNDSAFNTFRKDDKENKYNIGDTLTIKYLERNPAINKVMEFEKD
jgi:hypothetical protein